jgi:hypothetical protein
MSAVEPEAGPAAEALPYPWNCATTRHVVVQLAGDETMTARCPICHDFLVARQGKGGPYFHCHCGGVRRKEPAAAPGHAVCSEVAEPLESELQPAGAPP